MAGRSFPLPCTEPELVANRAGALHADQQARHARSLASERRSGWVFLGIAALLVVGGLLAGIHRCRALNEDFPTLPTNEGVIWVSTFIGAFLGIVPVLLGVGSLRTAARYAAAHAQPRVLRLTGEAHHEVRRADSGPRDCLLIGGHAYWVSAEQAARFDALPGPVHAYVVSAAGVDELLAYEPCNVGG
jgi:hypothetical protein